jgi:hypothetical protein
LKFNQPKCKCQHITCKKTPFEYPYTINGQQQYCESLKRSWCLYVE